MGRCAVRSTIRGVAGVVVILLAFAGCSSGTAPTPGASDGGDAAASALAEVVRADPASTPDGAVEFRQAAEGSGSGLKLGYISLGENVPFGKLVSDGIREQATRAGAELVFCDSKGDAATALDCVRNFKTQGVQGYLNFQPDAGAAASICAAGPQVPVIAIDIHQAPCERAFMGADNERAGYLAGKALGEYAKQVFDCEYDAFVSLEQPEAGAVNEARMGGQRRGFEEICGKIHDLRKENAFRIDQARTVFTDVLTSLSGAERILVVAINDDGILGATAAAKTAGRLDNLYLSGQGVDPSAWCEIKQNDRWVADVAYYPERYGEIGIPYLIDLVRGKDVPKNLFVPHRVANGTNVDDLYKVTAC